MAKIVEFAPDTEFEMAPKRGNIVEFAPDTEFEMPRVEVPQQESYLGTIGRGIARTGARAAESIADIPGNLIDLAQNIIPGPSEKPGQKGYLGFTGESYDIPQGKPLEIPKAREATKALTGEYLEPQGAIERFFDDVVGSLVPAAATSALGGVGAARSLGSATAGALAGKGTQRALEASGASPLTQAIGEIGLGTIGSIAGMRLSEGGALKHAKELYSKLDKSLEGLPQELSTVSAAPAEKAISSIRKELEKGSQGVSWKKDILRYMKELEEKAENGKFDVKDIWEFAKDVNNEAFKQSTTPRESFYIKKISSSLKDSLKNEYSKENPLFSKLLTDYDELYSGIKKTEEAVKHINTSSGKFKNMAFNSLKKIGIGLIHAGKNKHLSKYYTKGIDLAALGQIPEAIKQFNKAEKIIDHDQRS